MPFDATGRWIPEDDSVSTRLNDLTASGSRYIQQARTAGERTAGRRGLLNSSIAAGAAESAAIAAAAPIASQEAQQVAQRNQAVLEGNINYDNSSRLQEQQFGHSTRLQEQQFGHSTRLQAQQDDAAMGRQQSGQDAQARLAALDNEAQMLRQREAQGFQLTQQERDNLANMERLRESIASSDRQALLGAEVSVLNNQTSQQNELRSMYLQSLSNLSGNTKIKAADRNAYIAEFQRITGLSANLGKNIADVPLKWNPPASPPATTPAAPPTA